MIFLANMNLSHDTFNPKASKAPLGKLINPPGWRGETCRGIGLGSPSLAKPLQSHVNWLEGWGRLHA